MDIVMAVIFGTAFISQLILPKARFLTKRIGFLFLSVNILTVLMFLIYISWKQYFLWKNDGLGRLLLPPYQDFSYFIFYARSRFFNPYILSLLFGSAAFWSAQYLNKRYSGRFFEPIEPYLLFVSMFIQGTPGWLFYLIFLALAFLVVNSMATIYSIYWKKEPAPRISLYYFWLPTAIFTIISNKWLSALPFWLLLKI